MGDLQPIISSRDCPVCAEKVPWRRYLMNRGISAKWYCPQCHSLLTFDLGRRVFAAIVGGVIGVMLLVSWLAVRHWVSRVGCLIAGVPVLIAVFLFDHVIVIGHRNENYCVFCQYDLTGTIAAGEKRCPECGGEIAKDFRRPPYKSN
jgi:predicted RNA-binding Zn-ribbon protein involved in translation (DUF1610 family)